MSRHISTSSTSKIPRTFQHEVDAALGEENHVLHDTPSDFDVALNGQGNERGTGRNGKNSFLTSRPTFESLSSDAAQHHSRLLPSQTHPQHLTRNHSPFPPPTNPNHPSSLLITLKHVCSTHSGVLFVTASQFFGALMNVATRVLELENEGMHPFQVLFARMSLTMLCCYLWMWWAGVPDFPLGKREVRGLLMMRAFFGFWGIYGMYYSLQYLPVADATVITFLAPSVAGYGCWVFLREPFPRSAQYASLVSLIGVILIARPTSFFSTTSSPASSAPFNPSNTTTTITPSNFDIQPTQHQRLLAIIFALLGVLGTAGALTTIRLIGSRTHALIQVNYFAFACTVISLLSLVISPRISWLTTVEFRLPDGGRQWGLLIGLGIAGFVMQTLLTWGLTGFGGKDQGAGVGVDADVDGDGNGGGEMDVEKKKKKKTGGGPEMNMIYLNMVFAMGFDKLVFGVIPGIWSLMGSGLILGSAIWVAVKKDGDEDTDGDGDAGDEEEMAGMLETGSGERDQE